MTERPGLILGFDPGGKDNFGWCVCQADNNQLRVKRIGVVDNAEAVIDQVKMAVRSLDCSGDPKVLAAGIDAPMRWSPKGNRNIDNTIRDALKSNGFPPKKVAGTVQHVNSLRGGCSVQGLLLGKYLLEAYPGLEITETHPKALFHLISGEFKVANARACSH